MPIYEYDCPKCGRIEVFQKITDEPLTVCPECKKNGTESKVKKCISLSSFHLKGSGWYTTDYHGKNSSTMVSRNEPEHHHTDTPPTTSESSKPQATKPAAKTETSKSASAA